MMTEQEYHRRELYMRLYASLARNEYFYSRQFCAGIEPLLEQGHAVTVGDGYRLTEAGITAWKKMNPHVSVKPITPKPSVVVKEEPMTPVQIKILELLNDGQTHSIPNKKNQALFNLQDAGFVERVGTEWRITDAGRAKLDQLKQPKQRRQRKGALPRPTVAPQPIVPVARDTSLMQLEALFK